MNNVKKKFDKDFKIITIFSDDGVCNIIIYNIASHMFPLVFHISLFPAGI